MHIKYQTEQLFEAVIACDVTMVVEILNSGIDPNHTLDIAKVTVLHHAAQIKSLELVSVLIAFGAQIDARTEPEGLTPIEVALVHENFEVANFLAICEQQSFIVH